MIWNHLISIYFFIFVFLFSFSCLSLTSFWNCSKYFFLMEIGCSMIQFMVTEPSDAREINMTSSIMFSYSLCRASVRVLSFPSKIIVCFPSSKISHGRTKKFIVYKGHKCSVRSSTLWTDNSASCL